MPSSIVTRLIEEVATLKAQVASLLNYQKWTMALLSAMFVLLLGAVIRGR